MSADDRRRSNGNGRRESSIDRHGGEIRKLRVCVGPPRIGHAGIGWLYALDPASAKRSRRS
jgi:hypothetical protein